MLVAGDLWLERVLRGQATQGAHGVLRVRGSQPESLPGGAGGVARAAAAIGARTWVAGVLGQDAGSGELLRALASAGVDAFGVVTDPGHPTGERLIAEIEGEAAGPWSALEIELAAPPPLEGSAAQQMLSHIEPLIAQIGALVVAAFDLREPQQALAQLAESARSQDKSVIGAGRGWLPPCDLAVVGPPDAGVGDDAARALMNEAGHRALIVPTPGWGARVYGAEAERGESIAGRESDGPRAWERFVAGAATAAAAGADPLTAGRMAVAAAAVGGAAGTESAVTVDAIKRELDLN